MWPLKKQPDPTVGLTLLRMYLCAHTCEDLCESVCSETDAGYQNTADPISFSLQTHTQSSLSKRRLTRSKTRRTGRDKSVVFSFFCWFPYAVGDLPTCSEHRWVRAWLSDDRLGHAGHNLWHLWWKTSERTVVSLISMIFMFVFILT